MRAVVYAQPGDPDVLHVVDRSTPEPGPGEVRVSVHVSGVNPTDWKSRRGQMRFVEQVPNQDGAGVIDAVGAGVDPARLGEHVWLWEAAWQRADGTAQEWVTLPSRQAVALPDSASFELGASLGIPVLTAHRCLTVGERGPERLAPGALAGQTVLVAGGAGAVGNAAIQLARWAGATVVTTVSSPEKARLATAAGAHYAINYRDPDGRGSDTGSGTGSGSSGGSSNSNNNTGSSDGDGGTGRGDSAAGHPDGGAPGWRHTAKAIRAVAPHGVDIVVEVAPGANGQLDGEVLAPGGVIAIYATDGGGDPTIPLSRVFALNARWQGVLVYTVPASAKDHAIAATAEAIAAGAFRVGDEAGLPLHHFTLDQTGDAHAAVEGNVVGKVLIAVR